MSHSSSLSDCVLCQVIAGQRDQGVIAYQDDFVVVLPSRDQQPKNLGHMLVLTRQHYANLYDMPATLDQHVMACLRRTALAVQNTFSSSGTTIKQNNGPPGQDVFHTHFHVIPRYPNDDDLSSAYHLVDLATRKDQARRVTVSLATQH